jgi:hypothetical protein
MGLTVPFHNAAELVAHPDYATQPLWKLAVAYVPLLSSLFPLLSALCSLLSALCSLLSALCSLLSALCSLLSALCSLSLLALSRSSPA